MCHVCTLCPRSSHWVSWNWNYRHLLEPCGCWIEPGSFARKARGLNCLVIAHVRAWERSSERMNEWASKRAHAWGVQDSDPTRARVRGDGCDLWHGCWEPHSSPLLEQHPNTHVCLPVACIWIVEMRVLDSWSQVQNSSPLASLLLRLQEYAAARSHWIVHLGTMIIPDTLLFLQC